MYLPLLLFCNYFNKTVKRFVPWFIFIFIYLCCEVIQHSKKKIVECDATWMTFILINDS